MTRVFAGIALLVIGVLLAAFHRPIGNYFIDEHDDFWGRSRWTSWLLYTDRDKSATRRFGIVAGVMFVVAGLHVLFGILNFL